MRQCALPAPVVEELVERALSLLTCGYDPARKNVALFFGASIHFRGILDVFDRVGGLPRLLDAMRTVLLLLRAPAHGENRSEKQAGPFPALSLCGYLRYPSHHFNVYCLQKSQSVIGGNFWTVLEVKR